MLYGEFGEDFAVELDVVFLLDIDKSRIGETVFAEGVVEADDPETSEGSLLGAPVAVGVLAGFHDGFFGGAIICLAMPTEPFGHLEDVLSSFVGGNTAFDSWHNSAL